MKIINQTLLLTVILLVFSSHSYSQQVNNDPFTGSLNVSLPLANINSGNVSFPITAYYNSSNVTGSLPLGNMGLGWNLSYEGFVNRIVNDLPDDLLDTASSVKKYGWLYHNKWNKSKNLSPVMDCDTKAQYDSLADFGNESSTEFYDLKRDIFYISVPGHLNESFIIVDGEPISLNKSSDITIKMQLDTGMIEYMKVETSSGLTYIFSPQIEVKRKAKINTNINHVEFEKRNYLLYKDPVSYISRWALISIESQDNNKLTFEYSFGGNNIPQIIDESEVRPPNRIKKDINYYTYDPSSDDWLLASGYTLSDSLTNYTSPIATNALMKLRRIKSDEVEIEFFSDQIVMPTEVYWKLRTSSVNSILVRDIKRDQIIKRVNLNYRLLYNDVNASSQFILSSISEVAGEAERIIHNFDYYGIYSDNGKLKSNHTDFRTKEKDIFGNYNFVTDTSKDFHEVYFQPATRSFSYYPVANGVRLNGKSTKSISLPRLTSGLLKSIQNRAGGITSIVYEPNTFYDEDNQIERYGGGVRVERIQIHDGLDRSNDLIKTFNYDDQSQKSSGIQVYKPQFQFFSHFHIDTSQNYTFHHTIDSSQYTDDEIGKHFIVRSEEDISSNQFPGYYVAYEESSETVVGHFKTQSVFDIPQTHKNIFEGQASLARYIIPGMDSVSCVVLSPGLLPINSSIAQSYIKNGMVRYQLKYDAEDNLINKQEWIYGAEKADSVIEEMIVQNTVSPVYASAFSNPVDLFTLRSFSYFPISFRTGLHKNLDKIIETYYEGSDSMRSVQEYYYDADNRLSSIGHISPENRESISESKFSSHYEFENVNHNSGEISWNLKVIDSLGRVVPVEQITKIIDNGIEKVTGATLSTYKVIKGDKVVKFKEYIFRTNLPVDDFVPSYIQNGQFIFDNRYELVSEVIESNNKGFPLTILSLSTVKKSYHYGDDKKLLQSFTNIDYDEATYCDFEYESYTSKINAQKYNSGRLSEYAAIIYFMDADNNAKIESEINKKEDDYYISFWYKSSFEDSIRLVFTDINNDSITNYLFVDTTNNEWKLKTSYIDLSSLDDSLLSVKLWKDGVSVFIDDLLIVPEKSTNGTLTSRLSKDRSVLVNSDPIGRESKTYFNKWNEPVYEVDFEGNVTNIVETSFSADRDFPNLDILLPNEAYTNEELTFSAKIPSHFTDVTSIEWHILHQDDSYPVPNPLLDTTFYDVEDFKYTFDNNLANKSFTAFLKVVDNGNNYEVEKVFNISHRPFSVSLCHDRPLNVDLCNPDEVYNCSSIPIHSTPIENTLTLTALVVPPGDYSFEWSSSQYISDEVSNNVHYSNHPLDNIILDQNNEPIDSKNISISNFREKVYLVRVTDNETGQIISSERLYFTSYKSDPNCQTDPQN